MFRSKRTAHFLLNMAGLLIFSWTAGCGSDAPHPASSEASSAAPSGPRVITIKQLKFQPDVVTVSPGETVTWKNEDFVPHTATSDPKAFDSGTIAVGDSWSFKAPSQPGDYFYSCTLHPNMKAKLTVH
jgi:plastocyanin